jgi:hypothetical protein
MYSKTSNGYPRQHSQLNLLVLAVLRNVKFFDDLVALREKDTSQRGAVVLDAVDVS